MNNSFEITGKNDKDELATVIVKRPLPKHEAKAKIYANKVFADAINNGALLRAKLSEYMVEQGIWSDKKEAKLKELNEIIATGFTRLKKGGGKLSEAKAAALKMAEARQEQFSLLASRRNLDEFTAEGQAENAQFDFLCSICLLKEDGSPIYGSVDEYLQNAESEVIIKAATKLSEMTNGLDPDWEKKLPENEFLLKYKFVDKDLRLVDKEGNFISRTGKKIDSEGRYIDDEGNFINLDGERVDEEGNVITEFEEFEDDVFSDEAQDVQSTPGETPSDDQAEDKPPEDAQTEE